MILIIITIYNEKKFNIINTNKIQIYFLFSNRNKMIIDGLNFIRKLISISDHMNISFLKY